MNFVELSDIERLEKVLDMTKEKSKNVFLSSKFREELSECSYHLEKVIISLNEFNETLDN